MDLSRRELLTAFLGAPLAAAACRATRTDLPPGELVGASHALGHRLRGETRLVPSRWESHDVVIVGGGVAGLAAAWRIGNSRDTLLLELEPELGGTSRATASYPWGAHYIIAPAAENRALHRLLEEMGVMRSGVIGEEFLCRDPQERLFYRGRWYDDLYLHAGASPDDLRQLERFEAEIAALGKWHNSSGQLPFTIPMAYGSASADVIALDRISMAGWLDARGLTSPRLRWYVEYACRDDYGTLLRDTSAWAAIFYYASRGERPVITWPEGNGRLVAHLAWSVDVRKGWLAARVAESREGVEVIAVNGDGEVVGLRARAAVIAAPQYVARRIVPALSARPDVFTYGSWMVANLTLNERPSSAGAPLSWDNVLYESPSLGYVVSTHQRGIDYGPTVLTYYLPFCDSDPTIARRALLSAGRDEWAEVALTDLERAHPEIRTITDRVDIMRWGHAMVRPTPGFIWSEARIHAADPIGAIHFANTDLSGVPLFEEALYHGVRAAEEILAEPAATSWL